MDPIIKRTLVDPHVPLAPKGLRALTLAGFAAFLGATVYAKVVSTRQLEDKVARDMYSKAS